MKLILPTVLFSLLEVGSAFDEKPAYGTSEYEKALNNRREVLKGRNGGSGLAPQPIDFDPTKRSAAAPKHLRNGNGGNDGDNGKAKPPKQGTKGTHNGSAGVGGAGGGGGYDTRIIGGQLADVNEYPYFADFYEFGCGGSWIASNVILTSAGDSLLYEKVKVGAYERASTDGSYERTVVQEIKHPEYGTGHNWGYYPYDFMLVKLNEPVCIDESTTPLTLETDSLVNFFPLAGTELTAIGFGEYREGGPQASFLREVYLPVIDYGVCQSPRYSEDYQQVMFCAGNHLHNICEGDVGGPIVRKESDGSHTQVGVASRGTGCTGREFPGIFGKVGAVRDWIISEACGTLGGTGGVCGGECDGTIVGPVVAVEIWMGTDGWGGETHVVIHDKTTGTDIYNQNGFPSNVRVHQAFTAPSDHCIEFTVFDSYGDGLYGFESAVEFKYDTTWYHLPTDFGYQTGPHQYGNC